MTSRAHLSEREVARAGAVLAAEAHESLPVDELEAQQRVRRGVEKKPRDAAVVSVVAPLEPRSLELQQRAVLRRQLLLLLLRLLVPSPATTLVFTNKLAFMVAQKVCAFFNTPYLWWNRSR